MAQMQQSHDMVCDFRKYLEDKSHSPHTVRAYAADIRGLFNGQYSAPSGDPIPNLVGRLVATKPTIKDSTYRRKSSALYAFFGFLSDRGHVASEPRILTAYASRSRCLAISDDDFNSLVKAIDGSHLASRDKAMFSLMRDTGLVGEDVLGITYKDFILSEARKEAVMTGDNRRALGLTNQTADFLREYEDSWFEYFDVDLKTDEREPYFRNKFDEGLSPRSVARSFSKYLSRTNLPEMKLMSLRYAFAKHMIDQGFRPQELAFKMGITIPQARHIWETLSKQKNDV